MSTRKLRLDFGADIERGARMDDADDLIRLLCTKIGMIMEDVSVTALTITLENPEQTAVQLEELGRAAAQISALAAAAKALCQ